MSPRIKLWSAVTGTLFHIIDTTADYVQYLPTGQLATTYDRFGVLQVCIWNTSTGGCDDIIVLTAPGGVASIAFSPDCQLLALGHYSGEVTL